jgi:hypothetical protein
MSGTLTSIRAMKAVRALNVFAILLNIGALILNVMLGNWWIVILPVLCIPASSAIVVWQTKRIHARTAGSRPRPDYSLIASMERPIWGEAFEHAGAPAVRPALVRHYPRTRDWDRPPLDELTVGEVAWTVPWMLDRDEQGRFWLHGGASAHSAPGGTVQMRVERRPDGYHVWLPRDDRREQIRIDDGSGLPVVKVHKAKT